MSGQAFVGTQKRGFTAAVYRLLEKDYGILGSRRILEMLAQDLHHLVEQFYPVPERISSGWMVFTGTKAEGNKARIGQTGDDHQLVTLAWPVLLTEDLDGLINGVTEVKSHSKRSAWYQRRLVRIVEYGATHPEGPVLLTLADLSAMIGLPTIQISQLLQQAREETGKPLITKGYYFDQGMRPTHKQEILALYEGGMDEADIARKTQHALDSVGNYIRGYERVKLMVQQKIPKDQIGLLIDLQPCVVEAYLNILQSHHPNIFNDSS